MSALSRAIVKVETCECDLVLWYWRSSFKLQHNHIVLYLTLVLFFRDELMKKSNGTYFSEEV